MAYSVLLVSCLALLQLTASAVVGSNFFNSIIFPTEHVDEGSTGRTAEWFKRHKAILPITYDDEMVSSRSVSVDRRLVGRDYTVSALVPAADSSIYLLRRRQDDNNGLRGFSADGTYRRLNEGAIPVNCVVHLNLTTGAVITSFGNDTFYFPNAMVRDPQEHFWVSDAARHQVLRLNPATLTPDVSIGEKFTSGSNRTHLCAPNDVAVSSRRVYVADGRCNNRIVVFDKSGNYLSEFGKAPSPRVFGIFNFDQDTNQLATSYMENPRAIAVDDEFDRLYISENSHTRILLVNAGEDNPAHFGTAIRYFQHSQLRPGVGRIAIHPRSRTVLAINSYSSTFINRGFSFNTHDTSFNGAWGPDSRGFVRPRALAVTRDGGVVYVADACQDTPEKIWIFTRAENPRSRRNTRKGDESARSDDTNRVVAFTETAEHGGDSIFTNSYRFLSSKGQHRLSSISGKPLKVP